MKKGKRKQRRVVWFEVGRVFPSTDDVAVDLQRLMALHDDLAIVGDLMRANMTLPARPVTLQIAASRFFFLQRVLGGLVAELLQTLGSAQGSPEFRALLDALDPEGRDALSRLRAIPNNPKNAIYRVLDQTRNKATFHHDRDEYRAALQHWHDTRSYFASESEPGGAPQEGRTYYLLADQLAIHICYGLPKGEGAPPEPHDAFFAALDLQKALTEFLQSALVTYTQLRNLPKDAFTIQDDDDVAPGTFQGTSGASPVDDRPATV